jgi:hypothetical protein
LSQRICGPIMQMLAKPLRMGGGAPRLGARGDRPSRVRTSADGADNRLTRSCVRSMRGAVQCSDPLRLWTLRPGESHKGLIVASKRVGVSEKRDAGVNEAVRGWTEHVFLSTHAAIHNTFNSPPRFSSNAPYVLRRGDEHSARGRLRPLEHARRAALRALRSTR